MGWCCYSRQHWYFIHIFLKISIQLFKIAVLPCFISKYYAKWNKHDLNASVSIVLKFYDTVVSMCQGYHRLLPWKKYRENSTCTNVVTHRGGIRYLFYTLGTLPLETEPGPVWQTCLFLWQPLYLLNPNLFYKTNEETNT